MFKLFRREPGFYPRLISLALPILLQNLITNSLGLVDTFMVGTMGEGPLAGVTLANIPVFVVQLMMFGIQSGSSVLISQYRGKGDMGAINRVMGIGMYAAGAIGLTFALIMGFLPTQFMGLFGTDAAVVATAARYARIVGWSYLFDSFVQVYIGVHRAMGNPSRGLVILGASMASNTFLNWMFIFGNLGAPRLAEQGAALATLLARVLSCSIAVGWAVLDKQFKLSPALLFRPGGEMTRRFIRFSTPVMCNETFWGLGTSLFPTIMGHMEGSQEILAAYAIAGNITNLCTVGVFAISGTAAILIGQEIGSGRADRVYSLGALLNALAFLFGLGAGLLFLGLLHWFVIPVLYPLFGLSSAAGDICTMMLTVVFTMMPLRSFECTNIVGVLRGGGDVRMATLIDLTPLWVVALPLAVLSGLVFKAGIFWVYLSMMSENLVKGILGIRRFLSGKWINDVTVSARADAGV
ncbi:MAG: MATE family efflux transporter [Oscillospiraceae bacterium]|jgi:putative MATE family efflux protein|nr:MATE family efflux transporter [Oscillospiraceae bacterium]MCI9550268.1 MATE family efflux transporter [Oscillospiraceae bacterium]